MSVNNFCKNLPAKCKLEHQLKNFTNNYKVIFYQEMHLSAVPVRHSHGSK